MRFILSILFGFMLFPSVASATGPAAWRDLSYGAAPLQRLDFYPAQAGQRAAPLIVFVHGGGWNRGSKGNATGAAKIAHFPARGWAFATIDYRLVPAATVEQSAQDVADAVAWLVKDAARLGVDPRRVVLMGHSAGAHLAALVATDPRYLRAAGLSMMQLAGVVLLDGAAYDVPRQVAIAGPMMRTTYAAAFGADPARQRRLSPTLNAAAPNAARFLILHIDRADGRAQSTALAQALTEAGSKVLLQAVPGRGLQGHIEINRSLGDADYPATAIVDDWLAGLPGA